MRYTLLLHYPEPTAEELGPEALAEGMRAFQAYAKALDDAGVLASAEVLQQSSATTTVTLAAGELVVQDGPFADTKEQLGGTFVIDVPDLDAAIEWARRAPSVSWGHVEIRPTATRFVDGSWQGATAGQVTGHDSRTAAARAARESYGRLVALLAASTRDIALAEDALADAFERALRTWPTTGVPDNPQGWLMTVARNRIRDLLASAAVRTAAPLDDHFTAELVDPDPDAIPDKRLELLFACAHPAIDPAVRTPLMLQVVLGFDADRIARVFAVQPARWHSAWSGPSAASATPASRSGADARSCLLGCPPCSKPSTAPTRSTGSTSTSAYANRSPTRPVARRAHREPARHRARGMGPRRTAHARTVTRTSTNGHAVAAARRTGHRPVGPLAHRRRRGAPAARARTRCAPRTVPDRGRDPVRPLRPGPDRDPRSRHRRPALPWAGRDRTHHRSFRSPGSTYGARLTTRSAEM